jgi:excisionase family DNA binding protein
MAVLEAPTLLTTQQLADVLHVTVGTLHKWSYRGTGPRFIKVGGRNRYRVSDVEAWLVEQETNASL